MSKRKKPAPARPARGAGVEDVEPKVDGETLETPAAKTEAHGVDDRDSITAQSAVPAAVLDEVMASARAGEAGAEDAEPTGAIEASEPTPSEPPGDAPASAPPPSEKQRESERALLAALRAEAEAEAGSVPSGAFGLDDIETTVNVSGDVLPFPGRDDLDAPTVTVSGEELAASHAADAGAASDRKHLRGLLEALIFASDTPIKPKDLARLADAPLKQVLEELPELRHEYRSRGFHLEELAGGWVFRTSPQYAPFIRDLTKQKPVRLTRAQVETLAIIAYRQPITRPEIDEVRGVDSGPVLKLLLERDLVRILGKRDEVGHPMIYGTTTHFLEFFGLSSLKDLPTLREFTELTDESRDAYEAEMGEPPNDAPPPPSEGLAGDEEPGDREIPSRATDVDAQLDDSPTMITRNGEDDDARDSDDAEG